MAENQPEKAGESADLGLKKWRAVDDLPKIRTRVHRALRTAETAMYRAGEEGDRDGALKAARTLRLVAQTYLRVLDAEEIEKRLTEVEEALTEREQGRRRTEASGGDGVALEPVPSFLTSAAPADADE